MANAECIYPGKDLELENYFEHNSTCYIEILVNCERCITNTRTWWRILHSTSDERSESRVLCNILHHTRVLVIHLKQFTSICITFTLLNKQNLNSMHLDPW